MLAMGLGHSLPYFGTPRGVEGGGGGGGTSCLPIDPDLLRLILQFEGTDGSTAIVDTSAVTKTVTVHNATEIDTGQFACGTSSMAINVGAGTSPRGVTISDHAGFNFGTGDFFFLYKFRASETASTATRIPFIFWVDGSNVRFGLRWNGSATKTVRWYYAGIWVGDVVDSATQLDVGVWHEALMQRRNGYFEFFLNGNPDTRIAVPGGGGYTSLTDEVNMYTTGLYVGRGTSPAGSDWDGHIDQVLIGAESFDIWDTGYTVCCVPE